VQRETELEDTVMSETTAVRPIGELSDRARIALVNTGTNREGARVPVTPGESMVWAELTEAGLIGAGGGLTRKGSIARERYTDRLMDSVFGT
jgi:hypothetical protein